MKIINKRETEYNIDDIFLKRHSPRAMSGEVIPKETLMTLFEAARWAPSAYNAQPWRFIYAISGTKNFETFFSFLKEGNQIWCKNAGALVIILSKNKTDDGRPNNYCSFDTGSAWENIALQGANMDLVIHGIGGFELEKIKSEMNITEDYNIELMIAIGKHGKIKDLPEKFQTIEKPTQRKNLNELVFEGKM